MRKPWLIPLAGWLILHPWIASGQTMAGQPEVFMYGSGTTSGALIHDYENRWVEVAGASERFSFEQIGRSADTVELLDRSRDVGLRIHKDRGELSLRNSTAWQPWQTGKWISRDQLPATIQFVPTDDKIRLAYFVPTDRQPISKYEEKIRVVMEVVNDLYRTALRDQNYPFEGIRLERDARDVPIVHSIQGKQPAQYYNQRPAYDQVKHYQRVLDEIPAGIGSVRRHMIVVFVETYDLGPAPIEWNGSVGRGGHITADGGAGIMSAWILRDEFCATSFDAQKKLILDKTPITGRTALATRRPNSPRFEFIEDGFGAVAHELGHALGLPHDYRQPGDIMGNGFRSLQVNYSPGTPKSKWLGFSRDNARLLRVSRYLFSDVDRADNTPPAAEVDARFARGTTPLIAVSLKASDDRGLRAVVFHDPQSDTVVGGAELKGTGQVINLKFPVKAPKPGEFCLTTMLADAGGNILSVTTKVTAP